MREQSHVRYVLLIGIIAAIIIRNFMINAIAKRRTNHTIAVRPEAAHSLATVYYASRRNVWAFICTIYFLRRSLFVFLIWMRFNIKVYKKIRPFDRTDYFIRSCADTWLRIKFATGIPFWFAESLPRYTKMQILLYKKKKQRVYMFISRTSLATNYRIKLERITLRQRRNAGAMQNCKSAMYSDLLYAEIWGIQVKSLQL